MLYPLRLKAVLKDYIWGGRRLIEEYNKETDGDLVSESWELACHRDGMNVILNGTFKGHTLKEYLESEGNEILGSRSSRFKGFPLMIKLMDAQKDLSFQVHPDDSYAEVHENESGKTELLYILDAAPDASMIYGFSQEVTAEDFRRHVEENTLTDICRRIPVKAGDIIYIPAGTMHAIGKGILLAEIEQNANTTYRVYDYGRLGKDGRPRELHIDKALEVLRRRPSAYNPKPLFEQNFFGDYSMKLLADNEFFTVYDVNLDGEIKLKAGGESFQSLVAIDGNMLLEHEGCKETLSKGDSFFIPANLGHYVIKGKGRFLFSMV